MKNCKTNHKKARIAILISENGDSRTRNISRNRKEYFGSGQVAHLVRASSRYTNVAGSISGQGTYKKQIKNA